MATSYNNLGTVYTDLGDFQQEKHNYARALVIYLKQLGPYHIDRPEHLNFAAPIVTWVL